MGLWLNQHFLCSGAAELLRHSPETRQFLAILQKYVPFLLILLAKGIYDHRLGKLVYWVTKWTRTSCLILFGEIITVYSKNWYTGCPRRNVPDFGMVFLVLKYTDITQNTYVQSWTVKEIMAREKCDLLAGPRTVPVSWQSYPCSSLSVESYYSSSAHPTLIPEWRSALLHHSWAVICHVYCLEP